MTDCGCRCAWCVKNAAKGDVNGDVPIPEVDCPIGFVRQVPEGIEMKTDRGWQPAAYDHFTGSFVVVTALPIYRRCLVCGASVASNELDHSCEPAPHVVGGT